MCTPWYSISPSDPWLSFRTSGSCQKDRYGGTCATYFRAFINTSHSFTHRARLESMLHLIRFHTMISSTLWRISLRSQSDFNATRFLDFSKQSTAPFSSTFVLTRFDFISSGVVFIMSSSAWQSCTSARQMNKCFSSQKCRVISRIPL